MGGRGEREKEGEDGRRGREGRDGKGSEESELVHVILRKTRGATGTCNVEQDGLLDVEFVVHFCRLTLPVI